MSSEKENIENIENDKGIINIIKSIFSEDHCLSKIQTESYKHFLDFEVEKIINQFNSDLIFRYDNPDSDGQIEKYHFFKITISEPKYGLGEESKNILDYRLDNESYM